MKLEYVFVTGEKIAVEVCEELSEVMLSLENNLKNNNRKETRRHQSIDTLNDKCGYLSIADDIQYIENSVFKKIEKDKLRKAISKLKPKEQDLLYKLYLNKNTISCEEYAFKHNISSSTVRKRAERIRKELLITLG